MELNKSKGNMYNWIDKTINPLGGKCFHECSYCYVDKLKNRHESHRIKYSGRPKISENGMKQINGKNKMIFLVTMNDLFAANVPSQYIRDILIKCNKYDNKYLIQTKNTKKFYQCCSMYNMFDINKEKFILCTTIETNRHYPKIMNNAPNTQERANYMSQIEGFEKYITVEPILDFDLHEFVDLLKTIKANKINLGADSGNNNLPEPPKEKIIELISELEKFTIVKEKSNLKRLLK